MICRRALKGRPDDEVTGGAVRPELGFDTAVKISAVGDDDKSQAKSREREEKDAGPIDESGGEPNPGVKRDGSCK